MTKKDRMIGLLIAAGLVALGTCTWLYPDALAFDGEGPSGRGGRRVLFFLQLVWNRPIGSIAALLGLIVAIGAVAKQGAPGRQAS